MKEDFDDPKPVRRHIREGDDCWFVAENTKWYRVKLVRSKKGDYIIESKTGLDHRGIVPWPFSDFRVHIPTRTYQQRVRHISYEPTAY